MHILLIHLDILIPWLDILLLVDLVSIYQSYFLGQMLMLKSDGGGVVEFVILFVESDAGRDDFA